ncbi:unnamed protein product, partial [Hapterophycus canaliculatus]
GGGEDGGEGDDSADEDYCDEYGEDYGESEMIGSQIQEMFLRSQADPSQPGASSQRSVQSIDSVSPSPKRKRRHGAPPPSGQVLDLTETADGERVDDGDDTAGRGDGRASGHRGGSSAGAHVEDISDDDDDDDNDDGEGGFFLPGLKGGGGAAGREPPPPPKFRFFASVREHRDRGTSCVDFATMAAAPAGGASGTKSYAVRKTARDRKTKKTR